MRYVTRAAKPLYVEDPIWDAPSLHPSLAVDDGKEIDTGLVDEKGHAIYRLQSPIGFGPRLSDSRERPANKSGAYPPIIGQPNDPAGNGSRRRAICG